MKRRIDHILVQRGLFESRARAQAAIAAGRVTVNGAVVRKASVEADSAAEIMAEAEHPWVSRGALKLVAALDYFGFDPAGQVCADIGASTGGFTEVLLSRGANKVFAVDVGRDQLHARLRVRPEIVSLEQQDIRTLSRADITEPPSFLVIDVSFISLRLVLPATLSLAASQMKLVALIKPQFEVGRAGVKKGVVRDAALQQQACDDIETLVRDAGLMVHGVIPSPIEGGDGNREFLLGASRG
ncbi:16S/23S rRNA (cytidine-2'-O)-methyltransferase TlyA [Variibacter gotjawalensis]|uniref:16S/23S rRNA (Cytidine-2'-O)-methyltransferase TlyA n=1 Tax=Variibacter gotjawalensis TaxID=1333996 RepID=A0A0S3PR46_9BRAD|nr:TlyA family RNA methyltransferase [Variibacter gotjawalensis]RZS50543.1 23S rRNA (cytidine1920-2'-O)/16S rRNA (cytidine1409-2'-O)-methyltransferase [Variibacter gotjawalensis]BAT58377.1 16S/23S rRNA (cytidine-2'-O)-methyltransferase TlyA [Variibacter gotjawalensis]